MDKIALIFPGQGAQFVGMGKELYESSEPARQLFQKADSILGVPLSKCCFEGPPDQLTQTSWCQPALFVHSLAALAELQNRKPHFSFQATAGLSLGEFTALAAADWLNFEQGLQIVRRRGEFMQRACEQTSGAMVSILGMDTISLQTVCNEARVDIANLNCPGQIVISGEKKQIDQAVDLAKGHGAKKAIPLKVAGAYHSRLMRSAADALQSTLSTFNFQPSTIPVISNVTALPHEIEKVKQQLVAQVTSSVRWEDSIRYLFAQGFQKFIELGSGEVLSGFMKRIVPEAQIISIGKPADFEKLSKIGIA